MPRRYTVFSIAAVLTLLSDQLSKYWARGALELGRPTKFLGVFWDWELSYNPGSAFGLFNTMGSAKIFLSVVGVVACVAILFILHRHKDNHAWGATALGLIWAGALGNVIDRLLFDKVTDFVLWHVGDHRWPQFNVADAALVAGILILVFDIGKKKEPAA
jgi:signal peptidase II